MNPHKIARFRYLVNKSWYVIARSTYSINESLFKIARSRILIIKSLFKIVRYRQIFNNRIQIYTDGTGTALLNGETK